jgi:hypothetical protein
MAELTLADLRMVVDYMKANSLPPRVIKTQEEADMANERERALGLTYVWNVGDEYYLARDLWN